MSHSRCTSVPEAMARLLTVIARRSILLSVTISDASDRTAPYHQCGARGDMTMADNKFLTPEEVSKRYRDGISVGTLRNWRAMRIGPTFVKIGKAVLYQIDELDAWDQKNKVTCREPKRLSVDTQDCA